MKLLNLSPAVCTSRAYPQFPTFTFPLATPCGFLDFLLTKNFNSTNIVPKFSESKL